MNATNEKGKTPIRVRNFVVAVIIVAALAAVIVFSLRDRDGGDGAARSSEEPLSESPGPASSAGAPPTTEPSATGDHERRWAEWTGSPPRWPADFAAPTDCERVHGDLERICATVDREIPALRERGGACAWIEDVAAELAADRPDPVAELRSRGAILQNVFHVYRVLRRDRMDPARRALELEDLAEPAALALYRWAVGGPECSPSEPPPVRREALYDYAGFLFHTLGGQAYLRRRSPRVEALACFYGLRVLADAIAEGHNPHGFDPRPEIPRCRALLASQDLVFAERYVAELDAIADEWEKGGIR